MMNKPFTRHARTAILLGWIVMAPLAAQAAPAVDAVQDVVQRFTAAQANFDPVTLEALSADNYIEISPLGEVDPREKMLTFYVKKDDKPRTAILLDELTTRVLGDTAVTIGRVSYSMTVGGQSRTFALRSTFVAQRQGDAWKLVSAQYTPIRPAAAPARTPQ
ncbi:nuclear transport factor 2 family protein [Massilia oculi]|uniref:nuclear transport factor 2 family protein n=1 Tax=Massilia oculi TaxID=945844 RepID=UPI0028A8D06B|nr:nuclear transport factor 2 family protein [Massilia oculi]